MQKTGLNRRDIIQLTPYKLLGDTWKQRSFYESDAQPEIHCTIISVCTGVT